MQRDGKTGGAEVLDSWISSWVEPQTLLDHFFIEKIICVTRLQGLYDDKKN